MSLLTYSLVPFLLIILWLLSAHLSTSFPTLHGKRIVLLIAHPDDEAMFFSPTVQALTRPDLGNHLKILCLSTGNADGLGSIRRAELVKSGLLLGLRTEQDVLVLDDPRFPDSMTASWDTGAVAELLAGTFAPAAAAAGKRRKADEPVAANIDVLITFDRGGVSGHPNHISLYHGAKAFVGALVKGRPGWDDPVKLYTLPSVGLGRKYASVVDVPVTVIRRLVGKTRGGEYPSPLLSVSGVGGYRRGQQAMTNAHRSQMRWFRWGWIGVSRYMVVNDLKREKLA
ncbi:phosphatidylinositol glycan class L [Myriangium duriaei CBS 260.36]|uniref:N-acetylglucosaminylphosphatidylinositol deacetylase n=1 Tax=Myriangium duriaei CBS 260.36 TaxID=1168546 RepID=A0A9P4MRJ1_9PEZI|nr:phosphatidylinositol glycan class L [Myriangium duriaei CBS 260.36]